MMTDGILVSDYFSNRGEYPQKPRQRISALGPRPGGLKSDVQDPRFKRCFSLTNELSVLVEPHLQASWIDCKYF